MDRRWSLQRRAQRGLAALCFVAALAVAPSASHALLFDYDYKGPAFQSASSPYTTSDFVTVWFSVELPRNTDLPFEDYGPRVQAFTFNDGVQTITQDESTDDLLFQFQTDGAGDINSWLVRATIGERTISTFFQFNSLNDTARGQRHGHGDGRGRRLAARRHLDPRAQGP